ncbi:molybdenum cofactor biosynthesis protein MoaB [Aquibacillus koreensis]|uniref:Molybdenum cofactor biosynthesis protein B n=1 Tax=Aquibacillus koreensis TaxID=279446 RepID=A0A9X3WPY7_9BACI|nr:molybdenum cofactor biosynthesis protein B [Aquibacillus koreensis]MCT2536802.1 molybdenum cofactor biosynthesis protein MoaB [Aquibacillus koreensis]MDC3421441.1 molybdenum cofactor biosynthesis protein MoaB [Aquibacillus koreensis]
MLKNHRKVSPKSVSCMVITVSDTRTEETDKSGQLIKELLQEHRHEVEAYQIVHDEKDQIEEAIREGMDNEKVEAVIINGGTGVAKRDVTIEVVQTLVQKELPGFGEIFRYLSYEKDIGSAAILSRAVAGVGNDTILFSVPGSSGAVKLAMEKLILLEMGHIVMEIQKDL